MIFQFAKGTLLSLRTLSSIKKLSLSAGLLCASIFANQTAQAQNYVYERTVGATSGLHGPNAVAVDAMGGVYIADSFNNRAVKFDLNGSFVWETATVAGPSQLTFPLGIAIDNLSNVYVANSVNNNIVKFDSASGANLGVLTPPAGGITVTLNFPFSVKTDSTANVYVADTGNDRVVKFDNSGNFLLTIGTHGSGNGQLSSPQDIVIDNSGRIYVTDANNTRVEVFNAKGKYVRQFGNTGPIETQTGSSDGITIDSAGDIFVSAPTISNIVQKYDKIGNYLGGFGSTGTGNQQFTNCEGMAFDLTGRLYVADFDNNRVQVFLPVVVNYDASVTVTPGPFVFHRGSNEYVQKVTVTNNSGSVIKGVSSLVLQNLSSNATLVNQSGTTVNLAPTGSPYRDSHDTLDVGETITYTLKFSNPTNAPITYTPSVYVGAGYR